MEIQFSVRLCRRMIRASCVYCSLIFGLLFVTSMPVTAATDPVDPDPWIGMNRGIYGFNDKLDTWFLRPVASGYDKIMPDPFQKGVSNVFDNIGTPAVAINQFLQGKPGAGTVDVGRFLINTTIGLLGLFDVAYQMGLKQHEEDFGQTLAVWGVAQGPYLIIPLRGSSTVTHAGGMIVDSFLNPIRFLRPVSHRNVVYALSFVDLRARLLGIEGLISGDEYLFIRDAYLQQRTYLINDGEIEDDPFLDDEF